MSWNYRKCFCVHTVHHILPTSLTIGAHINKNLILNTLWLICLLIYASIVELVGDEGCTAQLLAPIGSCILNSDERDWVLAIETGSRLS